MSRVSKKKLEKDLEGQKQTLRLTLGHWSPVGGSECPGASCPYLPLFLRNTTLWSMYIQHLLKLRAPSGNP